MIDEVLDVSNEDEYSDGIVIVDRLRDRMKEMGINARQLAEKSKVGRSFVYDILNGKSKNPTSSKLNSICSELKIPMSYLLNERNHINNLNNYHYISSLGSKDDTADILINKNLLPYVDLDCTENLIYYRICDDSMDPILPFNSIAIINKNYNSINNGIFLIQDQLGLSVRRIESNITNGNITVITENKRYTHYECELSKIKIIGKVCFQIIQV
ncbi:LexA family transcriptional regulator [Anaplasmataceae bacterium AB001_6]|nr:LexA family transcriptional regulator [Anaplasmataceae bacterium AB001_6]